MPRSHIGVSISLALSMALPAAPASASAAQSTRSREFDGVIDDQPSFAEGQRAYDAGHYEEAAELWAQLLNSIPESLDTRDTREIVLLAALEALQRAHLRSPSTRISERADALVTEYGQSHLDAYGSPVELTGRLAELHASLRDDATPRDDETPSVGVDSPLPRALGSLMAEIDALERNAPEPGPWLEVRLIALAVQLGRFSADGHRRRVALALADLFAHTRNSLGQTVSGEFIAAQRQIARMAGRDPAPPPPPPPPEAASIPLEPAPAPRIPPSASTDKAEDLNLQVVEPNSRVASSGRSEQRIVRNYFGWGGALLGLGVVDFAIMAVVVATRPDEGDWQSFCEADLDRCAIPQALRAYNDAWARHSRFTRLTAWTAAGLVLGGAGLVIGGYFRKRSLATQRSTAHIRWSASPGGISLRGAF